MAENQPIEEDILPVEEPIPGEEVPTAGGSIISPSIEEIPELEQLSIGDQLTMSVKNITDEGIYELEVMPLAESAPAPELTEEGPGLAGLSEALL